MPKISVILPIFNPNMTFLDQALHSVQNQSVEDFECLCVCDSPSADLNAYLLNLSKRDKRFRMVRGNNSGLIDALNLGIDNAKGAYIARMDSDDICMPLRFEKQCALLDSGKYDVVGGHYFIIDNKDSFLSSRVVPVKPEHIAITLCLTVPFAHSSVMLRKSFLREKNLRYGQGNSKIAEDYQLWTQMFNNEARFGNVDDWILKYRWSENSLSQIVQASNKKDTIKIQDEFVKENSNFLQKVIASIFNQNVNSEMGEALCFLSWKLLFRSFNIINFIKNLKKVNKRSVATGTLKFFMGRFS